MSRTLGALSLQKKVSMTLLTVMAALVLLTYVILTSVVSPAFDQLELNEADRNLIRAERAIESDLANLDAIVGDWAPWDDAYRFALGEYPEFTKSNLDRPTLMNLNLDLLVIYDAAGRRLWGELLYQDAAHDPSRLGVFESDDSRSTRLVRHAEPDSRTVGLLRTAFGPMLISSQPIITSLRQGPIAGTMIMAQFLDEERLELLRERTEVEMNWRLLEPLNPGLADPLQAPNGRDNGSVQHLSSATSITSYGLLDDLYGEPLLELQVSTPRVASALGEQTVRGALVFLTIAGVVVAVATWLLLRSIIMQPLQGLARHIAQIRQTGDLTRRIGAVRCDEIGSLSSQFDKLTAELHDARRLLLEQSFKAGKADTAAEVLHNIRNAMTPLINGVDRMARYLKVTDGLRVAQATGELKDGAGSPDRREKLLQYVESAFDHIRSTCGEACEEIQVISKQARQVEAILSDQEQHANVPPVIEDLDLGELLGEAVLVVPKRDERAVEITMGDELPRFRVRGHRIGLLQVMGNIILNAYESITRSQPDSGIIRLSAIAETVEDQSMVRITVSDTGGGFDEQTGRRIFQRGYSSKQGHMSGLGLH
ncbi:MAG: CHASE4 domain-containing protein, partial [Woeseiaceae bacterium]